MATRDPVTDAGLAPKPFKGSSDQDETRWVSRFDRYVKFRGLSEEQALASFPLFLEGYALDWYDTLPEEAQNDMIELKRQFKARYSFTTANTFSKVAEVFSMKQRGGENTLDFIAHVQHEAAKVDLPVKQTLQAILNGLSTAVRPFILQQGPKTIEDIRKAATLLDQSTTTSSSSAQPSDITETLADLKQQIATLTANISNIAVSRPQSPSPYRQSRVQWTDRRSQEQSPRSQSPHRDVRNNTYGNMDQQRQSGGTMPAAPCNSCGEYHFRSTCKFRQYVCRNCDKIGHIAKVCRAARFTSR